PPNGDTAMTNRKCMARLRRTRHSTRLAAVANRNMCAAWTSPKLGAALPSLALRLLCALVQFTNYRAANERQEAQRRAEDDLAAEEARAAQPQRRTMGHQARRIHLRDVGERDPLLAPLISHDQRVAVIPHLVDEIEDITSEHQRAKRECGREREQRRY